MASDWNWPGADPETLRFKSNAATPLDVKPLNLQKFLSKRERGSKW
jgi:hypothetical protein